MKRFHNGHKTFTSAESTAIYELQTHEQTRRDRFEQSKNDFVASRNPLTGAFLSGWSFDILSIIFNTFNYI